MSVKCSGSDGVGCGGCQIPFVRSFSVHCEILDFTRVQNISQEILIDCMKLINKPNFWKVPVGDCSVVRIYITRFQ